MKTSRKVLDVNKSPTTNIIGGSLTNVVVNNFIQIRVNKRSLRSRSRYIDVLANQVLPELGVRLESIGFLVTTPLET